MHTIAIIGAGAVGCYFGVKLAQAGFDVTIVARQRQAQMLNEQGLVFQSDGQKQTIPVKASEDPAIVGIADLVLLCVKSYDTEATAQQLAPHLRPETVVLCMQNGVNNAEVFAKAAGHPALPAVVYVAAEMDSPTHLAHKGAGHIVIGVPRGYLQPGFQSVAELAAQLQAAFPCRVSEFIERDLWQKLIINCAFNGISAVAQRQYGDMIGSPEVLALMDQIVVEGVEVAGSLAIPFELQVLNAAVREIGQTMAAQYSSTAQDVRRGKRTEIDALNGYVARLGAERGIPTVANQAVYAMVKLVEKQPARNGK
jgi:2-dehydropantoate 2-reductase